MKEVSGSFLSNNDKLYEINRLNNSNKKKSQTDCDK